ncbi:MAG: electron transfer flavoprotein subunit alpha/FixB family protein [Acidobacteriota bacterium]|nr:MAG: electron transfer flavoprotein subunit alpha/FixB family protein [Acidobacteriota bacterium]
MDVIIILFSHSGYDRAAQGVAGAGRTLAASYGARLSAVVVGPGNSEMNSRLSMVADEVVVADQPELSEYQPETHLAALTAICREESPVAVLLGNDTWSQEIVPRLAHRLGGSAAGDGIELAVVDGAVRVRRSVYGGKAVATIALRRSPAVLWLRARAFDPAPETGSTAEIRHVMPELPAVSATRIIERKSEQSGEARLEDARVIVSGGRGLGGPEPFADLRELAGLIGAQVAASRAACDSGWCPPSWQVGQTGKKVAPGLYLAVAIRGASQHMAGISDAKVIAAINIDPDAPIFKHCRFGIVEDYKKVIPLLKEKLAGMKG